MSATTPEELERWRDITREALAVLREKQIYSEAMIEELKRLLEEYRSGARAERDE